MADDDIVSQMNKLLIALSVKDPNSAIMLKKTIDMYKQNISIDRDLLNKLKEIAKAHKEQLITGDQYTELINKVNNNSIIIYFKTADVFRVYDGSQISSDLTNHLNADFKKTKGMYEVIPNNLPQKIVIMCENEIISHMNTIKNYVVDYMKSRGVKDIKNSDIKTFENDSGMGEIIINGFYVSNYGEREKIVSELIHFINIQEQNSMMTNKMKCAEFTPFDSKSFLVAMPNCKKQINGEHFDFVETLIGNLEKCRNMANGNVYNINIIQTNNVENINLADTINTTNIVVETDDAQNFIDNIIETKPSWFTPGKYFNKEALQQKYTEQYGDVTKQKFHKLFHKRLFKDDQRVTKNGVRILMVKLCRYEEIK